MSREHSPELTRAMELMDRTPMPDPDADGEGFRQYWTALSSLGHWITRESAREGDVEGQRLGERLTTVGYETLDEFDRRRRR